MPCKAPAFMRRADCPGPGGLPAASRCARCARGLCEAPPQAFVQNCQGPDAHPPQLICPTCLRLKQFRMRRGSMANLLNQPGVTGPALQRAWTGRVETIVEEIWTESLPGPAPCNYAVCMAGSGARHEASPYSDLDFFILLEDDSPTKVDFFERTTRTLGTTLSHAEGNSGLRLCNIMSPLGDSSNPRAPKLIRTPHNMAALVELPPERIEGHVSGGLLEHRFLFGTPALHDAYRTDLNVIVAKTCCTFSSRPLLTRGKRMGLQVIKDLVGDARFTPPSKDDKTFHVKEQFYRPPQFIAKGLAWYYGIDAVSTTDQLTRLVADNHMSNTAANNFRAILNVMGKMRFRLHLDREGEKDFIYLDQAARDREIREIEQISPLSRSQEQKERYGRLKGGTHMSAADVRELVGVIPNLTYIMRLAREFVRQKEKKIGKRENPFLTA